MSLLFVIDDMSGCDSARDHYIFVEGLAGDFFAEGCRIIEALHHRVVMTCLLEDCRWLSKERPLEFWEYLTPGDMLHFVDGLWTKTWEADGVILKDGCHYNRAPELHAISLIALSVCMEHWRGDGHPYLEFLEAYMAEKQEEWEKR